MSELKPCPFCERGFVLDNYGRRTSKVAKAAVIKAWNTRNQWISVDERLPETERNVLAYYINHSGKYRIVKGYYVRQYEIEAQIDYYSSDELNDEYCEEKDNYYLKEGWYESLDNWEDYGSVVISNGKVTFWQPLPAPPEDK